MSWFRVDDAFARHRKVRLLRAKGPRVTADALALWLLCGLDCAAALGQGGTVDGFVRFDDLETIAHPMRRADIAQAARALVDVGLWSVEADACGYLFHDWKEYQPTSASVKDKREKWKREKRGQRGVSVADTAPDSAADSAADSGAGSAPVSEVRPSRARARVPAPSPSPSLPDHDRGGDLDQVARPHALAPEGTPHGPAHSLSSDAETIRAAVASAFERSGAIAPRSVRDLDGKPWVALVEPLRARASKERCDLASIARRLADGFIASQRARKAHWPIAWLVENPGEYLGGHARVSSFDHVDPNVSPASMLADDDDAAEENQ